MLPAEATIDGVLGNDISLHVMSPGLLDGPDLCLDLCLLGGVKLCLRHISFGRVPPTHKESKGHKFGL